MYWLEQANKLINSCLTEPITISLKHNNDIDHTVSEACFLSVNFLLHIKLIFLEKNILAVNYLHI